MPFELQTVTTRDLLRLYVRVLDELRSRGITRSTNNPVADYAEFLCAKALSLTKEPQSTKGFDASDATGQRYEIKGRRVTSHNSSRQMSALRDLESHHFEYLAGVLFREDFSVWKACLVPYGTVCQISKFVEHTNSWKFVLRDDVWDIPGVVDITNKVIRAHNDNRV